MMLNALCEVCGHGFCYPPPQNTGRAARRYCSETCRKAGAKVRLKERRASRKITQPERLGRGVATKEKTLRCQDCTQLFTFDVDREGYVVERCRCGTRLVGAST